MPDGALMETATIHGIPLYDGDVEEREGVPAAAAALKERIAVADGLLLFTPEYNNSIPGPFKNAIDWLTRPSSDVPRVFRGKPTALMGATPGGFGTNLAQAAWLPVLRQLGVEAWFGARLHVARAPDAFDEDGVLKSEPLDRQLRAFLAGFTEFVTAGNEVFLADGDALDVIGAQQQIYYLCGHAVSAQGRTVTPIQF